MGAGSITMFTLQSVQKSQSNIFDHKGSQILTMYPKAFESSKSKIVKRREKFTLSFLFAGTEEQIQLHATGVLPIEA